MSKKARSNWRDSWLLRKILARTVYFYGVTLFGERFLESRPDNRFVIYYGHSHETLRFTPAHTSVFRRGG